MRERRLVKVAITFELLFEWLTEGNTILGAIKTTKGLPKDATFIGSFHEDRTMTAWLIFQHESFEQVLVGSEIPYFDIQFTRYYEPEAERILLESMQNA